VTASSATFAEHSSAAAARCPTPGARIIQRKWLTTYDEVQYQSGDCIIISWDIALSETEFGDYSACVVLLRRKKVFYVLEVVRGRFPFDTLKQKIMEEGCAPRSGSPTDRGHCSHPDLVRAAPPLRPDMIFGRHNSCALLLLVRSRFRFQLGAFHQLLRAQPKLIAAPGAAAPDKTNLLCRIMAEQRSGNEVCALKQAGNEVCALKQAGIDCESRQQGGVETVVDHLHQCRKARRLEALGETPVGETADCKRVVTQAVTILQQQQVLAR
jgi:hypothetical protein